MLKINFREPTNIYEDGIRTIVKFYLTDKPIKFHRGYGVEITFDTNPYYQFFDHSAIQSIEHVKPTEL